MYETDEAIYSRFLAERREDDLRILLDRHRESLTLFLSGYVHDPEEAEDLMLDAYAEAAAGTRSFSGRSSFKTWLFAIGKKKAQAHLRKTGQASRRRQPPAASDAPSPELELLRNERDRQLYLAMSGLKTEYRQVLTLLYFEQMSCREAGAVLGKGRKQVYNLAERGRKALRTELERMGFDDAQY